MKLAVLDADGAHNKKLQAAVGGTPLQTLFVGSQADLLDTLNGQPQMEIKKKELETALNDAVAMLNKAQASVDKLKQSVQEKRTQGSQGDRAAQIRLDAELKIAEKQHDDAVAIQVKLAQVVEVKKAELERFGQQMPKADQKKIDLCLVDRSFLGTSAEAWIAEFRKMIQFKDNQTVPLIIMGYNEDIPTIEKSLVPGIADYFVKPVDLLLFRHNVARVSGKSLESDEKTFELQTGGEIKLLRKLKIQKMSEFEMVVLSSAAFEPGEFVELAADVFNMSRGGRLLARCLSCIPDSTAKGFYNVGLSFVGLSSHTLNELRKWLKLQFVNQKQKGG